MTLEIKSKYIILCWIILLILFTFYCIIRLKYIYEKYVDISEQQSQQPATTQKSDIFSYINNIQTNNKNITGISGCENVYDDNIRVQSLGYNNCGTAYADYISKNIDITNKFGQSKSLEEICPVSCKSEKYSKCLQTLLSKFSDNANMLDKISVDMSSSINKRLQERSSTLTNIDFSMNSLVNNPEQNNFRTNMFINGAVAKYPSEIPGLVNSYYKSRYQDAAGMIIEQFADTGTNYIINTNLDKQFFGKYEPVNGQFIAFNDLVITLGYDDTVDLKSQPQSQPQSQPVVVLNISSISNNLNIKYTIFKLDNYKNNKNVIQLILSKETIISQPQNGHTVQQLLATLGIKAPTQLLMVNEEFISTENIKHQTYKLLNENLDTILILNKNPL